MGTKIIFLRHAETTYNLENRYDYLWLAQLTQSGKNRAIEIANYFADTPINTIYSSPLQRALDTIAPLAERKKIQIRTDSRITETTFLDLQWLQYDDEKFIGIHNWNTTSLNRWESMQDLAKRTHSFLEQVKKDNPWETILICSHVSPIAMMLMDIDGFDWDDESHKYLLSNKAILSMFTERII